MEGNGANTPEPAPQKGPSKEKENDKEIFEIQAGPVKIKGRQNFILALILGLLGGGVIFYLVLFQLKRPQIVYRVLVEEPFYQTLTAAPTAIPLPPQTIEITKVVTQFVPTVFVTRETVIVTNEVVRRETVEVVVTEIVRVPQTVIVTPPPTEILGASELLERDLKYAFDCGETALIELGDNNIQDWDEDQIERLILAVWEPKCEALWVGLARARMIDALVQILKHFTEVDTVVWNADIPQEYRPSGNSYDVIGFRTTLQINGKYQCPSNIQQEVTIRGDETPLIFDSSKMKVEVQQNYDRIVILEWVPVDDAIQLLNNNCR